MGAKTRTSADAHRAASPEAAEPTEAGTPDGAGTGAAGSWGHLLRRYRGQTGLTQEELAERSGYSTNYISKLERDQRLPPPVAIDRLATVLGLDAGERAALRAARAQTGQDQAQSRSASLPPMGLPTQATSFVGRHREIAAATALLRRDDVHLLTLTGPGGIGKTRLALQVAAELAAAFPEGIVFIPLASLVDPDHVADMVAATLGLKESGGTPLAQAIAQYLRHRQTLLVLDNFEHLLPAAPFVAEIIATCPRLRILITSRSLLQLSAEHRYEVPPLTTVAPEQLPDAAALARQDAVALFVDRARAVRDSFALTDANAAAVCAICRCLDGLPLAIELAAARVRLFPPQALLQQLTSRLALLVGGSQDRPARHQTLRGTMDWSYQLLSPSERLLFARLSIFAGGCSFAAVEAVCNLDGTLDVVEAIGSLVDKSLVRQDGEREPRFSLLETIREYAGEKLAAGEERESVRRRHAEHFLSMAQAFEPALTGPHQDTCLAQLDAELDNLRGALGWLLAQGRVDEELRLAGALYSFWLVRGHCSEGRRWLEEGLARGTDLAEAVRAEALWGLGGIGIQLGDHERVTPLLEQTLALFRVLGDEAGSARTLNLLGVAAWRQGAYARAITLYEEGLQLATALGNQRERAFALLNLGIAKYRGGDRALGRQHLEEALALNRVRGDRHATLHALINLGYDATLRGDLDEAEAMFEEVLATARGLGMKVFVAYALQNLATVSILRGEHEQAAVQLRETLLLGRDLGDRYLLVFLLADLAKLEVARGWPARAARLGGAVAGLQGPLGITMAPEENRDREQVLARAREELGAARFRHAWESGQCLSLDEAVAGALDEAAH
ncbi:MAG TPA: tetratricopeptide repeat protein [Chloroflexota bacterium]|nr:tetratricopeptide repeat protein [Chloroflexota bacterium]